MKFKVSTFSSAGFIRDKKISWIKEFRDQTECSLRDAKALADWLELRIGSNHRPTLILDTDVEREFHFLHTCLMIELGRANMIQRIKVDPKKPNSTDVLKNTAIRLIRMGEFGQARDVLKILM